MNGFVLLSSQIGIPIFSKQYKKNFGLTLPSTSDSNNSSPPSISDTSLSGLILALKLNAEFSCQAQISFFQFSSSLSIYFCEHDEFDIMCAVFVDTSIQQNEDQEFFGSFMAYEICYRFAKQYPEVVSIQAASRRRFNSFQPSLNLIFRDICMKYMKLYILKLQAETEANIQWMFLAYSQEYFKYTDSKVRLNINELTPLEQSSDIMFDTPRERPEKHNEESQHTPFPSSWIQRFRKFLAIRNKDHKRNMQFLESIVGELQILHIACEASDTDQSSNILKLVEDALSLFQNAGHMLGKKNDRIEHLDLTLCNYENDKSTQEWRYIKLNCIRYHNLFVCFPNVSSESQLYSSQDYRIILDTYLRQIETFLNSISNVADISLRKDAILSND